MTDESGSRNASWNALNRMINELQIDHFDADEWRKRRM